MAHWLKQTWSQLTVSLMIAYAGCFGLYLYTVVFKHIHGNLFLIISLVLALVPLLLSWRLVVSLKQKRWSSWEPMLLTLLWLSFIPGSFYALSDYIHLQAASTHSILLVSVLYSACISLAFLIGLISLYLVHVELKKRLKPTTAGVVVALVLIGISFAIYLGQDLNWSYWDIMLNPVGLIFDISNVLMRTSSYPDLATTTSGLFILLGSVYLLSWRSARLVWHRGVDDLAAHIKRSRTT